MPLHHPLPKKKKTGFKNKTFVDVTFPFSDIFFGFSCIFGKRQKQKRLNESVKKRWKKRKNCLTTEHSFTGERVLSFFSGRMSLLIRFTSNFF
jgi:hypothetical protein